MPGGVAPRGGGVARVTVSAAPTGGPRVAVRRSRLLVRVGDGRAGWLVVVHEAPRAHHGGRDPYAAEPRAEVRREGDRRAAQGDGALCHVRRARRARAEHRRERPAAERDERDERMRPEQRRVHGGGGLVDAAAPACRREDEERDRAAGGRGAAAAARASMGASGGRVRTSGSGGGGRRGAPGRSNPWDRTPSQREDGPRHPRPRHAVRPVRPAPRARPRSRSPGTLSAPRA